MIRRDSQATVTDLFCGAGGWTEGAEQAGALVRYGVNHWERACETYGLNHPNANVDCNDISSTNPGRYPRTDILIASPECTTHSPAGGSRPRRSLLVEDDPALEAELQRIERSRVTMMDVIRFAEHHRYDAIIVENVVEVRRWELFDWWLRGMTNLGYEHQAVFMNSMVAWPTPQSRDRIYIVFWRKGNTKPDLKFDVSCWCPQCQRKVLGVQTWKNHEKPWGKYRTQYVYRCPNCNTAAWPYAYPAATAIDWSLPAPRIGDRKKPLADATMRRIRAGLEKFGPAILADTMFSGDTGHVRSVEDPMAAQTARQTQALVLTTLYAKTNRSFAKDASKEPLDAITANESHALVVPLRRHAKAERASEKPLPTIAANGTHQALLVPAGGTWNDDARPVDEPMRARTSRDNEALLTTPFVMTNRANNVPRGTDEPLSPVNTGNHHAVVSPPGFIMKNYTPRGADVQMSKSIDEPLGTVTAQDHHSYVAFPFLTDYHGQGSASPVTQPMGVVDTRDRRALVYPEVNIDDCGFRMLEPHEIKAAMAFPDKYVITGNKREQVKQCGNAVTPPVSAMLLPRIIESLYGREV